MFEDAKDDPEQAVRFLWLILTASDMDEARYAKALYLLKTLALARPIGEGRFQRLVADVAESVAG